MIQVAIMASVGRPKIRTAMLERLVTAGGLYRAPLVRRPRIYFAGDLNKLEIPEAPGAPIPMFEVVPLPLGPPLVPQFWRVFLEADPTADLLFLEDDAWIIAEGVPKIAALELPTWAGAITFFDFRNEGPREVDDDGFGAFWPMPIGRDLWGTQCVLVPARVVRELAEIARKGDVFMARQKHTPFAIMNAWDGWLGRAVESIGLRMTLHSPSWVQHLGVVDSMISPLDHTRPMANDFPEDCPTIVEDFDIFWCSFHGVRHDHPNTCPATDGRRP